MNTETHQQLERLALSVLENLQFQHDWTDLKIHTHSAVDHSPLPRPLVSGLPPRRLYLHPDDQIELVRVHHQRGTTLPDTPESEWVLPTLLAEKWSLKGFAAVFDALPRTESLAADRPKRLLLATTHADSTVQYYIMHDGTVKPRQN